MSNVNVCDQCDQRIHEAGPRWHVEYDSLFVTLAGFESTPLDFCSRECLRVWAMDHAKDPA